MQVHQPSSGVGKVTTARIAAEKVCGTCQESLPADAEFFYRDVRSADGLRSVCKACYSELPSVLRRRKEKDQ
ncbi:hypothetical protein [Azotobacter beijerinckii]|uniref:Uncharacterized protein n=1 Tax=Azotobacter beijerinckii TaxID=170623 RepID=A0A1I0ZYF7_9GAMM|nr:hypothetical protein [Azotobacter beijerinckii]SFB30106.1 hypothetical protein SAMN04244571_02147 [Azotobacter beijerinckii]